MNRGFIGKILMIWFEARLQHASSFINTAKVASNKQTSA